MTDPWEKAYVYGHYQDRNHLSAHGRVAHIFQNPAFQHFSLCDVYCNQVSPTPDPYPVCRNCLGTKRAKELGLA